MIKKLVFFCVVVLFGATYAGSYSGGEILDHQEWVTGGTGLHYKISTSKRFLVDKLKTRVLEENEQEDAILRPFIESVETDYTDKHYIHTKIKSHFSMQVSGFYSGSEPQNFKIYRRIFIIPGNGSSVDQVSSFNSKDIISVSSDILNSVDLEIDILNLPPGTYIAEVKMSVGERTLPIMFSTLGNSIEFTINSKL